MKQEKPAVLLTFARGKHTLNVCRELYNLKYDVHVADCLPMSLSGLSNHVTSYHTYRPPFKDPCGFINDLRIIIKKIKPIITIPLFEETLIIIENKAWDIAPWLEQSSRLKGVIFRDLYSKVFLKKYYELYNINQPSSWILPSENKIFLSEAHGKSFIFKPDKGYAGQNMILCNSFREVNLANIEKQFGNDSFLAQKYIYASKSLSIGLFAVDGIIKVIECCEVISRTNYGFGTASIRIEHDPSVVISIVDKLISNLKYSGLANIDLIKSNKEWYVLDFNPRGFGSIIPRHNGERGLVGHMIESIQNKSSKKIILYSQKNPKTILWGEGLLKKSRFYSSYSFKELFISLFTALVKNNIFFDIFKINDLYPILTLRKQRSVKNKYDPNEKFSSFSSRKEKY